jgi:DNA anti-recombination protein RmuC
MEPLMIIGIICVVLLIAVIVLQIAGRKKSDIGEITALLRRTAEEQRDNVSKQIAAGTTEQFQRFGVIQESVQSTLQGNREEVNKQLREFQAQMETRLTAIQQSNAESNERISASVNKTLTDNRAETNKTLLESRTETNKQLASSANSLTLAYRPFSAATPRTSKKSTPRSKVR